MNEGCRHLQVVAVMTGPDPDKDAVWLCTKANCRRRFVPAMALNPQVLDILASIDWSTVELPSREDLQKMSGAILHDMNAKEGIGGHPETE